MLVAVLLVVVLSQQRHQGQHPHVGNGEARVPADADAVATIGDGLFGVEVSEKFEHCRQLKLTAGTSCFDRPIAGAGTVGEAGGTEANAGKERLRVEGILGEGVALQALVDLVVQPPEEEDAGVGRRQLGGHLPRGGHKMGRALFAAEEGGGVVAHHVEHLVLDAALRRAQVLVDGEHVKEHPHAAGIAAVLRLAAIAEAVTLRGPKKAVADLDRLAQAHSVHVSHVVVVEPHVHAFEEAADVFISKGKVPVDDGEVLLDGVHVVLLVRLHFEHLVEDGGAHGLGYFDQIRRSKSFFSAAIDWPEFITVNKASSNSYLCTGDRRLVLHNGVQLRLAADALLQRRGRAEGVAKGGADLLATGHQNRLDDAAPGPVQLLKDGGVEAGGGGGRR
ncbi:hypothetical protein TYRP_005691 [Tyrophagus putrescentiae]|nr:hypothetical protein TYRP_005691 [Tyrophagus putrescentiae]